MKGPLLSVGRRVRFRHVQAALAGLEPPRSILDAGCGDGRLAGTLARRYPRASVLGIDPDADKISLARAASRAGPNLRFEVGAVGGSDLGLRFDGIVCIDVLEHIRDDEGAFQWLARHLAPQGALILHVPASGQRHVFNSVDRALKAEVEGGQGPHFREGYDPGRLRVLTGKVGLSPERLVWTFHRRATRWAVDGEHWTFLHRAKPIKALVLPALLLGASLEQRPSAHQQGNGLLLVAAAGHRSEQ